MYAWSEEHEMMRSAVRQFVEKEVAPHQEALEHGDMPPYDILRKMFATFGLDTAARESFERRMEREANASTSGGSDSESSHASGSDSGGGRDAAMSLIPTIELCRYCPGMVTALGVSVGLTAAAIASKGTPAQKRRWVPDLLSLKTIGSWAITEPGSGSDAFGSMRSTARRDGDEYLLNGSKTFITNGPFADTIVFICKLDEGASAGGVSSDQERKDRKVLSFVLDRGMPGLEQSPPLRKMGMHSSPTGQLFLTDVRVGRDRLIGETEEVSGGGRDGAKVTFAQERAGVAAMALGIIEQCLELSVAYAKDREQFGQPIGQFQLIQEKLARMEVARLNTQNLVYRYIEMTEAGRPLTLAEASAMKLYTARAASEVAMEAVQLFGGNGYMAEFRVEQLARDAKVLQIYAGTDEIQITHIAKDLLRR
ncbi:acyl-CoA dehydrogenase family protein [Acidiferrimicrobium sp. IK]|uniref:acyl-CoA dehydrogenase family protein n=1 Tax=Acidiferrimicrobium sp. IK TaxID=2871700 RepID=UPI0021CB3D9B|nr:acyl-CoA dehydrogenase family protein [Acidiferrimicrobium sp. IK]MCU4183974.1 acyl-CoA dehydrogenase family protein [Acidiferrimicrobium sp. IK]